jgi:hypothetical protein
MQYHEARQRELDLEMKTAERKHDKQMKALQERKEILDREMQEIVEGLG